MDTSPALHELREKAKKKIAAADNLLFLTYPLVNEPKLLLVILDSIYGALEASLDAFLLHELSQKRIPAYDASFSSKLAIFTRELIPRYHLTTGYAHLLGTIRTIMVSHHEAPVEFSKKDTFVICSDKYDIKTVSVDDLKNYLTKAKIFIQDVDKRLTT